MPARKYILVLAGLLLVGVIWSQGRQASSAVSGGGQAGGEEPKKTLVNVMADRVYSDQALNRRLGLPQNATILVGRVAFEQNGAVIACDSAVRYSDRRLDCFSATGTNDVIINKDSTFIYCNRVEYNGEQNLARVYSPVIKVVDGDATLYAYNFSFNTLTNTGRWWGGGVVYQQDNEMESENGFYYSDLHELVAMRNVDMRNDAHRIESDSVRYNTETRIASFYTRTYIWTEAGEMIAARQGRYNTADSAYFFHGNAYILDEFREGWADTIDYKGRTRDGIFYGNIQIDDREHHSSAFGDFARYWGERGETMLTRTPTLVNYDAEQGNSDTLYLRADTIFMYVRYPSDSHRHASAPAAGEVVDSLADGRVVVPDSVVVAPVDSVALAARRDSVQMAARTDSLARIDSIRTADPKAWRAKEKAEQKRLKTEARKARLAEKAAKRATKSAARAEKIRLRAEKRAAKLATKLARRRKNVEPIVDSLDSIGVVDSLPGDSLALVDSLPAPDSLTTLEPTADTTFRIFRGWHNVRFWRRDTQGVCDSMVGFSVDSTIHLYVKPVLWNGSSQITADSIVAYTANQKIDRAEFYGNPIMASQIGESTSRQFNQVKGRRMSSHFRDGELHRHDTDGNAQALYYMQEEETDPADSTATVMSDAMAFVSSTAANISFIFSGDSLLYIVQRQTVDYTVFPMDQIPAGQPTQMSGFRWQIARKPTLRDVFYRYWRPSERERHEAMPGPEFPIAARITKRRDYLVSGRMWADRTEKLPAYAEAFRREKRKP